MFPFFSAVGADIVVSVMDFYNLLFFTVLISGLIFTFPPFFVLLVKYNIANTRYLRNNRKYLYLVILVIALIVSPGGSPQGNILLFLPMVVLFEISIFFGKRYEKKIYRYQCKFCESPMKTDNTFCPACKKAQV
jgi:sec-independent protein translocase protein TatC